MVGVPGRSKACITCRNRKKGCDFQRPSCHRCLKAKLECGGYDRPRIFINSTAGQHPPASSRGGSPIVTSGGDGRQPQGRRGSRLGCADIALPQALLRSAQHERCIGEFWHSYLPSGRAFPASAAQYASGAWTNVAHNLCTEDRLVRLALWANGLSKLGRQEGNSFLMRKSHQAYDTASNSLSRLLSGPVATSDATLVAVRLLLMYAITHGGQTTKNRGWSFHSSGILSLLQAKDPRAYSSGNAHQMFADFRLPIIIAFIRARKACQLSRPEWKTKPWTGREKLPKDHLIDILSDVPGLLQDVDRLQDCDDEKKARALKDDLELRCRKHDQELDAWHKDHAPKKQYRVMVRGDKEPHTADDLAVVYVMSLAWTAAILLHSVLRTLGVHPDRLPKQSHIRFYLREIAKCTRCFLHPSMGAFGKEMAVFPLGLALQFLADPPADMEPMHEERCMFRDISRLEGGAQIISALSSLRQDSGIPKSSAGDSARSPEKQWVGAWPFLDKRRESKSGGASSGALLLRQRT